MSLNNEQQKNILEKLNELWRPPQTCTICGKNIWEVSDKVFELREFHGGGFILGDKSSIVPVILVSCKHCGHTLAFNALLLGIIKKDESKADKQ